jgi:hypothetical protein
MGNQFDFHKVNANQRVLHKKNLQIFTLTRTPTTTTNTLAKVIVYLN